MLAMAFVFVYMVVVVQSWFLAIMGMGQILLSFGPAYFVYFFVGMQRMGLGVIESVVMLLGAWLMLSCAGLMPACVGLMPACVWLMVFCVFS